MKSPRSGVRIVALAAGTLLLLAAAPVARADHSWGDYHWARSANPFALEVIDNVTADWDGHLDASVADWTASSVLNLNEVAGEDSHNERKRCTAVTGKLKVCNAAYGFNGWLGIAEIWLTPGSTHISKARARMNDTYFKTATYNDPDAKLHVMCQEIGHTLGLDHQTAVSCMDDVNGLFDPAYASPNAHDYDQLETIYSHVDSSASAKPNRSGKGNGHKITVIFWAPGKSKK